MEPEQILDKVSVILQTHSVKRQHASVIDCSEVDRPPNCMLACEIYGNAEYGESSKTVIPALNQLCAIGKFSIVAAKGLSWYCRVG